MIVDSSSSSSSTGGVEAEAILRPAATSLAAARPPPTATTTDLAIPQDAGARYKCLRCKHDNPSTRDSHDKQICRRCGAPRSLNLALLKTIYINEKISLNQDHRRTTVAQTKLTQMHNVLALQNAEVPASKRHKKRAGAMHNASTTVTASKGNIRTSMKQNSDNTIKSAKRWYRGLGKDDR